MDTAIIIADLKENYGKKGFKSRYFMDKYGLSFDRVHYLVGRSKLSNKRKTTWEEIKPLAIKEYEDGGRIDKIAAKYRIGEKILTQWLKEIGPLRELGSWARKYNCNENFFEEVNAPEKAYWLGFIAADGFLTDRKRLGIALANKDESHLRLFCDAIESNFKFSSFRNAKMLWVARKKIYFDLKKLGISERKTASLSGDIFNYVPEKFMSAFMLGYFDGDGCFGVNFKEFGRSGRYVLNMHLIANKEFLERYVDEMKKHANIDLGNIKRAPRTRHSYFINKSIGPENAKKLYEYFYGSQNSSTHFLKRKQIRLLSKLCTKTCSDFISNRNIALLTSKPQTSQFPVRLRGN